MRTLARAAGSILTLLVAGSVTVPATAGVLDFDSASPGGPVSDITVDGVTFSFSATGGLDEAWLYDSTPPIGDDPDLEGPFYNAEDRPLLNDAKDMFNLLIVQEKPANSTDDDPDDNARGGTLFIDFDQAITILAMDVIDASLTKGDFSVSLFDGSGTELISVENQFNGDTNGAPNFYETLTFGAAGVGIAGVERMEVYLVDISGAVDNIAFVTIPAPATLPLLLACLALGACSRRARG